MFYLFGGEFPQTEVPGLLDLGLFLAWTLPAQIGGTPARRAITFPPPPPRREGEQNYPLPFGIFGVGALGFNAVDFRLLWAGSCGFRARASEPPGSRDPAVKGGRRDIYIYIYI